MKTTIYCAVIFFHGLSLLAVADQNTVGLIAAEQNAAAFLENTASNATVIKTKADVDSIRFHRKLKPLMTWVVTKRLWTN